MMLYLSKGNPFLPYFKNICAYLIIADDPLSNRNPLYDQRLFGKIHAKIELLKNTLKGT